jgi:hypothetical protein
MARAKFLKGDPMTYNEANAETKKPLPMPLTREAVEARVAAIACLARDDEAAHAREDDLHVAVLQAIAAGTWRDAPAVLCAAALKTKEIEFARWCA